LFFSGEFLLVYVLRTSEKLQAEQRMTSLRCYPKLVPDMAHFPLGAGGHNAQ